MITKISLKNFMSHTVTELELGPGFNVITGPNNCGKSAIVAAIQLVCRNHLTGDVVVRHGTRECTVTLWTDDDHEITWRRKGKDTSYTIDGTEYTRLKGSPPEVLHTILKLPEIEEGDACFDVHFGLQKEPIFLLDEAGSKAAKFFASSSDAARLMEMQSLHKSRTKERKTMVKLLEEQAHDLQEQIHQLSPVQELRKQCEQVKQQYQELLSCLLKTEQLKQESQQLTEFNNVIAAEEARQHFLSQLPALPEFISTDELEDWINEYQEAIRYAQYMKEQSKVLEQLKSPPEWIDIVPLKQKVDALRGLSVKTSMLQDQIQLLEQLSIPPVIHDNKHLDVIIEKIAQVTNHEKQALRHLEQIQQDNDQLQNDIGVWLKHHPECPVCERPWKLDQVIRKGGHQHG